MNNSERRIIFKTEIQKRNFFKAYALLHIPKNKKPKHSKSSE